MNEVINALVFDRTAADVANQTPKGFYSVSDLNRVGQAVAYMAERFRSYGYTVPVEKILITPGPSETRYIWEITDIPAQAQMRQYRDNVAALRGALAALKTTPETPASMEFLTWSKANDIEQILVDIDVLLTDMAAAFRHCGAAICGVGGLIR